MEHAVKNQGIYELCHKIGNKKATAKTVVGYDDGKGNVLFFEGETLGQIIAPIGIDGFGWDEIFQPDGVNESFAEMDETVKLEISMRTEAFKKLKAHLGT